MALVAVRSDRAAPEELPICLAKLVQNKNEVSVDALPYLDKEYDNPSLRELVDRMVEEEMKKFEPTDYIASLPPVPAVSFEEGSHLRAEWDRVAADESSKMQAVDETRYACRPPEGKDAKKEENWLAAIRAANTQLEHTAVRAVNADMLNQYGVNSWRAYNSSLEDQNTLLKAELEEAKVRVVEVNRKRMAAQLTSEHKLQKLASEYRQAVQKNLRLEAICIQMEKEAAAKGGDTQMADA